LATNCYGQYLHRTFHVAALPPTGHPGALVIVTDALTADSCLTGGGTKRVFCTDNGTAWVPFDSPAGSGGSWGSITGTLSNQTDLQSALDGKSPSPHNHAGTYEPAFASGLASEFFRGDKTWQTLDKTAVGLANVDNTSDASKPISTATQTVLDGKAAVSHGHAESEITNLTTDLAAKVPTSRAVNGHALTADVTVTAADVGLGNVNNTSDADKPISTATQTALNGKQASLGFTPENAANKNAASGYAGLDSGTKLSASQLPNPGASTLGGTKSLTCNGTDKLSAIGTDGLPVCSADQGGAAAWGSITGTLSNQTDLQTALNDKAAITLARKQPVLFTDCLNILGVGGFDPFYGAVVSSGTINGPNAGMVTTHHPGVVRARSSTTTNSGYWIGANAGVFLLGGGEAFEAVFNITTLTNGTFRFGFHDSVTSADAVDGVYLEMASTGVATGKTAQNSTRSSTGTTYTVSIATWYRLLITVSSTARVDFYLYSDAGTQLWTDNLTTNIPSASGRETGAAVIGTNVGTTATDLYHLDWLAVYFSTARTR
jgi:hypothetical protein